MHPKNFLDANAFKKGLIPALAILCAVWTVAAWANPSKWIAPDDERAEPNPIERTAASLDAGLELYIDNCATCHGETGTKGPGTVIMRALVPDLTDAAWGKTETDGSLYYKIAVGKDPMMASEEYLGEDEIWHIVNYIRTLIVDDENEPEATAIAATDAEHASADDPRAEATHPDAGTHHDDAGSSEQGDRHHGASDDNQGHSELADGRGASDDHGDDRNASHGDAGGGEGHGAAFDREGITNYEPSGKKAPLAIALIFSIALGGIVSVAARSD